MISLRCFSEAIQSNKKEPYSKRLFFNFKLNLNQIIFPNKRN